MGKHRDQFRPPRDDGRPESTTSAEQPGVAKRKYTKRGFSSNEAYKYKRAEREALSSELGKGELARVRRIEKRRERARNRVPLVLMEPNGSVKFGNRSFSSVAELKEQLGTHIGDYVAASCRHCDAYRWLLALRMGATGIPISLLSDDERIAYARFLWRIGAGNFVEPASGLKYRHRGLLRLQRQVRTFMAILEPRPGKFTAEDSIQMFASLCVLGSVVETAQLSQEERSALLFLTELSGAVRLQVRHARWEGPAFFMMINYWREYSRKFDLEALDPYYPRLLFAQLADWWLQFARDEFASPPPEGWPDRLEVLAEHPIFPVAVGEHTEAHSPSSAAVTEERTRGESE